MPDRTLTALFVSMCVAWLAMCGAVAAASTPDAVASSRRVTVHLFWTATCPHCRKARVFVEELARNDASIELVSRELDGSGDKERAFEAVATAAGVDPPVVPLIVIGDEVLVGYDDDATTGEEIRRKIAECRAAAGGCPDRAAAIIAQALPASDRGSGSATGLDVTRRPLAPTVRLPIVGDIETRALSLPVLTVVLAAVDGFNPCAMWVLVLLIGLMAGLEDRVRMWALGAVFLVTTALVYLAFLTAWLNVFLVLGALTWMRIAVGGLAVVAGGYYLVEFVRNPDAQCAVTSPGQRQRVRARLVAALGERSFVPAAFGIATLAVAVNMIELLCSAGIPAVYTQVLAMSDVSPIAYAGYLLLYITVFLLDDVMVFVGAMLAIGAAGLATRYARISHLIGGMMLLLIGGLLIVRPEWLAFA